MKILFTADLHIKLGQKNIPKDWQINRYRELFKRLNTLQHSADIMILGGDIFDRIPTLEELELYFELISNIIITTYIFDGNHEATKKGHTFLDKLSSITYAANNHALILNDNFSYDCIDIIPYKNIKKFNPKDFKNKILCTHVRGNISPHVKEEIDLNKLNRWDVVLAGDLHAYSNSQRNILYPGSPLSINFHRNPIKNGIILFDTNSMTHDWIDLKLPQLIRKTVNSVEEAIPTEYDHTIYEIEGDIKSLSNIENNELIDKKIINKNTEATLSFKDKSMSSEIREYLSKVLKLKEYDIENIMEIVYDNIEKDELE